MLDDAFMEYDDPVFARVRREVKASDFRAARENEAAFEAAMDRLLEGLWAEEPPAGL